MDSPHTIFARYFGQPALQPFLYALSSRMAEGHVCLPTQNLPDEEGFWSDYPDGPPQAPAFPEESEWVGEELQDNKPFILQNGLLYLSRYYGYESQIIKRIRKLTEVDPVLRDQRIVQLVSNEKKVIELRSDLGDYAANAPERPDWKLAAALMAWLNNFTIITGGPGTGKTTTVSRIIKLFKELDPKLRIAFAAPTGKAAVRMEESLGELVGAERPMTIHSLLGSTGPDSHFFKRNTSNPLPYDVLIIDESSMIGAPLFAKLLDAVGKHTRVILIGDSDQLASVDTGSLFGDLCFALQEVENKFTADELEVINPFIGVDRSIPDSQMVSGKAAVFSGQLIRLLENFRFHAGSPVGQFTRALRAGDTDQINDLLNKQEKELQFDPTYSEEVLLEFARKYTEYVLEPDIPTALEKLNKVRILCAVRQSEQGVERLNERVETILKKLLKEHLMTLRTDKDFYEHQPVMVTRNRRELGLSNGDVGIIRLVEGLPKACFPCKSPTEYGAVVEDGTFKNYKAISIGLLTERETVYAMTIHKSQGSEFDHLLVVLPTGTDNRLLTRELLYTALTRMKDGGSIIIQGTNDTIIRATERRIKRLSGIVQRLSTH